MRKTGFK